jgi:hypothetical protein
MHKTFLSAWSLWEINTIRTVCAVVCSPPGMVGWQLTHLWFIKSSLAEKE